MSRKNRHHVRGNLAQLDSSSAASQIEKLLASRQFKDALKEAKVLFQREPGPAQRGLVERAYFGRFEQLLKGGMPEGARQVAEHLLEFGITDAEILARLVPQLLDLGLGDQASALAARIDDPQARAQVEARAADHAVLHPDKIGSHEDNLRSGVLAVRGALAALDAGNEPLAWEQLRDIPRSSPFADWRLFARGLAALRKGDAGQVSANWDRLDPQRAAHRIAKLLQPQKRPDSNPSGLPGQQLAKFNWPALELKVFGEPVASRLEQLGTAVHKQDWREFRRLLGPLVQCLKRIDVSLAQRLTELLLKPIVEADLNGGSGVANDLLIQHLITVAEPVAIDPNWNRLRALFFESDPDEEEQACGYWKQYAQNLSALAHLTAGERSKMQALVYRHVGESYAMRSEPENDSPFARPIPKQTVKKLRRLAVESMEESIRLDATARESYELLGKLYEHWGQPANAAATALRQLAVFPDDLPTLRLLIEHHLRNQPEQALPLIDRVRRLKPLDETIAIDEIRCRQALARQHALGGRWDEARAELALSQALWPADLNRAGLSARMAALEFKAGQMERAEELLRDGQLAAAAPAVFWLYMSIESARHQLGKESDARFAELLKSSLSKKVSSKSAGQLSEALAGFVATEIGYPGKELHIRQVVACLKRSTLGKLDRSDLIDICQFIRLLPKENRLFEKLVRKGVKAFPDSVYFLIHDAEIEFDLGPHHGSLARMRKHLERAHELLPASRDPRELALGDKLKHLLGIVRNIPSEPNSLPFGLPSGLPELPPGLPPELAGIFEEMFSSMPGFDGAAGVGEDDADDFNFFFGGPPRRPRSKRKRK